MIRLRALSVVLTISLYFLPFSWNSVFANDGDSFVDESPEDIKLSYKIISEHDKTAEVTGMAEEKVISDYGRLTIPAEANGYSVISISEGAFRNNSFINKVIVSEGIQFIKADAFLFCPRLKTIILPSTIQGLDDSSLYSWIDNIVLLSDSPVQCDYHVFDTPIEEMYDSDEEIAVIDKNTTWHIGTFNHSILFVPKGFKKKYADACTWSLFREIEEIDGLSADFILPPSYDYQRTAFNLFDQLSTTKKKTDNICFSPLSAQLALSMVMNGANGNTLKEMKWATGLSDYSDEEINSFNQTLIHALTSSLEFNPEQWEWLGYPVCEIANSIWHRPDFTLFGSFTDTAKSYYEVGIGSVWFDTQEGVDEINQWVNEKTHSLIPRIYSGPQSADLAVVLADALYFKGAWHTPFDKERTRQGVFHNANGGSVMADMMAADEYFLSTASDKFRTITLPYGNGDFSMTIFLPTEGTKLPELTRADWSQTVSQPSQYHPYALTFPRFDFGDSHELNDILKKMGMRQAFDQENADFTRMTDGAVSISKVFQLDKISVDEKGTEAAAVTVADMAAGISDPVDGEPFAVDRPFYFTIENRKEKAVLFVGRVATLEGEPFTPNLADVNADNTIDISDIVAVINVIAGTDTNDRADVNADGKTDISDIVAIINAIKQ